MNDDLIITCARNFANVNNMNQAKGMFSMQREINHLHTTRAIWFSFVLVLLLWTGAVAQAQKSGESIFTLGRLDGSSSGFSSGSPQTPVRIQAQDERAARGWYAFQPVTSQSRSADGIQDAAHSPQTIVFSIDGKPSPVYTVSVSLLFEHSSVPALRVAVDGHTGDFYPAPDLSRDLGDGAGIFFPAYSTATVRFLVPGTFLKTGENEISFSAVSLQDGPEVPDAGFSYDAITMSKGEQDSAKSASIRLTPTIFYRQGKTGLEEAVDLVLRTDETPVQSATVTINKESRTLPVNHDVQWGEQRFRIYVPEFPPHTRAKASISAGGHMNRLEQTLEPAKRWTVFITPHVHFDLGYTDYQAKVASVQSRVVDEALDLLSNHPEFRFSLDGMWSLEQFINTRTTEDKDRALDALKVHKLFIPANYCNELTGFASGETLIRSLYPSAQFSFKHDLPLNYASITDVPSYSWSYASILASAGIHQLVAAGNNGRAPVFPRGHLDENSPFWWEGPDGKKVLFWYAHHYHQMWMLFGLPPLLTAGEQTLPLFLQRFDKPSYKSNSVLVYGSQVENSDLYPEQAQLVQQWNRQFAYPQLKYTGFHEALTSIAADFHDTLPIIRGDGGPYWEDGIGADAYYAAMERETEARAPSAEKLATISMLENPRIALDKTSFDSMWKNIVLMDEHTWLSAASYSDSENDEATVQLAVKDSQAVQARQIADFLIRQTMANLADLINIESGNIIVFNTLNWQRDAPVSLDLRKGVELVDNETGAAVPLERAPHGEYTERVTFLARNVPATGYRTFSIHQKESATAATSLPRGNTIENEFYRVELDPSTGTIQSIFDKQLKREVVDTSAPYRFGQYLYVTTDWSKSGTERYVTHGSTEGKLLSITQTPDWITAELASKALETPHIHTTIKLFNQEKKILITQDLEKEETKNDEAVYFAFPLAMAHPRFKFEIQNGTVDPAHDMYPGAGLDWFSVQHWSAAEQDGLSAAILPLDAPLMTFGDISRQDFPETFSDRKGMIFSYAMNNYWHTNYRAAQGGHFMFRYVFTSSAATDEVALSRLGWEEATPLEVNEITPQDKAVKLTRPLDGTRNSFLQMSDSALVLQTWKSAEDGRGTILRFLDIGGSKRKVHVTFPHLAIEKAWLSDALERDQTPISIGDSGGVDLEIAPHAIVTVRIVNRITAPPACGRFCDMAH
jgi:alpha-mannosidase